MQQRYPHDKYSKRLQETVLKTRISTSIDRILVNVSLNPVQYFCTQLVTIRWALYHAKSLSSPYLSLNNILPGIASLPGANLIPFHVILQLRRSSSSFTAFFQ